MLVEFLKFIKESSPKDLNSIIICSIAAGLLQGLMVFSIGIGVTDIVQYGEPTFRSMLIFIICLCSYGFLFTKSMNLAIKIVGTRINRLVEGVADKLRTISYQEFQDLDKNKIYTVLLGNNDMVIEAARFVGPFFSGICMVFASFLYSLTISPIAGILLFGSIALMASIFIFLEHDLVKSYKIRRAKEDEFFGSLKDIVMGFVELKMNKKKSDELFEGNILKLSQEYYQARNKTYLFQSKSTSFYMTFSFIPVGFMVFFISRFLTLSLDQVAEFTTIALFTITPVLGLCLFIPTTARAVIILRGLTDFYDFLEDIQDDTNHIKHIELEEIKLENISFTYPKEKNSDTAAFELKIPHFSLKKNDFVILRGSNGSGKSSFMRLFAGLTKAQSGNFNINGKSIENIGYSSYRNMFSCVFTDFYLFNGLYGIKASKEELDELLELMGLSSKLNIENGRYSTTSLSSGQRKRLALLTAILENRQILLFDEVAADFDHHFREFFYLELLPKLKAQGRTLLVISHDDRYFHVADRVVTMTYGNMHEEPKN